MKHKLNFDGTRTKETTMEEHIDREFLMLELGLDDLVFDALNDAADEVKDTITNKSNNNEAKK